jgi:O-antigen/teichoic acid export membrane protein
LLLLLLVAVAGPWRGEVGLLLLAGLVAVTQFGSDPATWVFFGRGRVDIGAAILIADRLLYLVAINGAAYAFHSATGLVLGALGANLLRMAASALWVRGELGAGVARTWELGVFQRLVGSGAALGVAIIASVTYASASIVLMRTLATPEQLGYYAMGYGIVTLLLVVPTSLTMALFPTFAQRFNDGEEARLTIYELVARLNLLIVLPLCVGLLSFPAQILAVWIGVLNETAALNLRILGVAVTASTLNFMYRLFFFALDRPAREAVINLVGIVLIVALGVPLHAAYGGPGIAAAYVAVEVSLAVARALALRPWLGLPGFGPALLRTGVAALLPAALLQAHGMPIVLRVGAYLILVLLLTVLLRLVPEEFVQLAKGVLRGQKLDAARE